MNTLDEKIIEYQKKGWILLGITNAVAQLRKPVKRFSCLPNLIWTLVAIVGFVLASGGIVPALLLVVLGIIMPVIYVIDFLLFRRERFMTLFLNDKGLVQRR